MRILLASDDPLARGGLAALLAGQERAFVVGQAGLGDDWPSLAREDGADLVLADLGGAGADLMPLLEANDVPALVLVADDTQARAAALAGARGILRRDTEAARLHAAIGAVALGLTVTDFPWAQLARPSAPAPLPSAETLTPRETEVLGLLSEGLSNRQIGLRLGIGERTAKFHVNAILAKLGAETRTEAVVLAARLGLVIL